jgi:hypothetical protein
LPQAAYVCLNEDAGAVVGQLVTVDRSFQIVISSQLRRQQSRSRRERCGQPRQGPAGPPRSKSRTSKKQLTRYPTTGKQLRKDPGTVPSLPGSRPACKLARVVCVPCVVVHTRQLIHIHGTELALILVMTMSQEEKDSRAPLDVCSVSDFDVQWCASWVGVVVRSTFMEVQLFECLYGWLRDVLMFEHC